MYNMIHPINQQLPSEVQEMARECQLNPKLVGKASPTCRGMFLYTDYYSCAQTTRISARVEECQTQFPPMCTPASSTNPLAQVFLSP